MLCYFMFVHSMILYCQVSSKHIMLRYFTFVHSMILYCQVIRAMSQTQHRMVMGCQTRTSVPPVTLPALQTQTCSQTSTVMTCTSHSYLGNVWCKQLHTLGFCISHLFIPRPRKQKFWGLYRNHPVLQSFLQFTNISCKCNSCQTL